MSKLSYQRTVRFDAATIARLKEVAADQHKDVADVIRSAVRHYFNGKVQLSESELRHLRVSEYTQAALDTIISQNFPDTRNAIVAETNSRMAKFHGQ